VVHKEHGLNNGVSKPSSNHSILQDEMRNRQQDSDITAPKNCVTAWTSNTVLALPRR